MKPIGRIDVAVHTAVDTSSPTHWKHIHTLSTERNRKRCYANFFSPTLATHAFLTQRRLLDVYSQQTSGKFRYTVYRIH